MLDTIIHKALSGEMLSRAEAMYIATKAALPDLFAAASRVREHHRGKKVDLCSIVSARTGACPEDCAYCAQSTRSKADVQVTSLMGSDEIRVKANSARASGARRFCVVTSGTGFKGKDLSPLSKLVSAVKDEGLLPCATLGLMGTAELTELKTAGLVRYHHNLETSREYFPQICTTHSYEDKLATIASVKEAGLSLCCGGIFGLGESWADRVEMSFSFREAGADSVPINFLVPVPGTPLGERRMLGPLEALRVVSLVRLVHPTAQVRICGGRLQTLGDYNSMVFLAGADGLLTGDCLTVAGCEPDHDLRLIDSYGLEVR
jgi:biotin synthase